MQPRIHLRYTSGKPGSVSAVFYIESDMDVFGWHARARGRRFSAAFFMIDHFYSERATVLYRSVEDDVYGPWIIDAPGNGRPARCPLPEPVRHELERIQSRFVEEWLAFENDPASAVELSEFRGLKIPTHAFNIRPKKLRRMDRNGDVWEYRGAGLDMNVVDYLEKYWHYDDKTGSVVAQRPQTTLRTANSAGR